ncbi:hypothetical protein G7054_g10652 [Neopestalotiopsis clavispora]|nr:hypothetical protein G7054_g10652 [Neopestalotiopsis clavispora]
MYIVNATEFIPELQKQWRTISFAAIAANAGSLVGISKSAVEIMHRDLTDEHSFSVSWPKFIVPIMSPGENLDRMSRRAIEVIAKDLSKVRSSGVNATIGLWQWMTGVMDSATCEAVWGPGNPYRDPKVFQAWKTFEAGFLTLSVLPLARYLYPQFVRAREVVGAALTEYVRQGGPKHASGLVQKRFEHHRQFGLSDEDIARGELGNTFAVLGSTTPCALWVIWHILSDDRVLADVLKEVTALVHETADGEHSVDLAAIRTHYPVLLSTFQETMRFRTVTPGARVLLDDVLLDGRIKLRKGSMLMLPAAVQHTNESAWGGDANTFDHLRFTSRPDRRKPNRTAFRGFGGGHVLCPGRHFASNEIMALAALLVLQFDIVPTAGKWVEPTWKNSPPTAGFPVPDEDLEVEFRPRNLDRKWKVVFSGADEVIGIVSEDLMNRQE